MLSGFMRAMAANRRGDPTALNITRNEEVARRNRSLADNWGRLNTDVNADLSGFRSAWSASQPERTARSAQEAASLNPYFDGGFLRDLSNMRSRSKMARDAATELAISRGLAGDSASAMAMGTAGPSSYRDRLRSGMINENLVNSAMADAAMERGDYLTADAARNAAIGRRNAITEADLASLLTPTNMSLAALGQLLSQGAGVNQQMHNNAFYGLKQDVTGWDKAANIMDGVTSDIGDIASIYMGAAGGGMPATGLSSQAAAGGGGGGGGGGL